MAHSAPRKRYAGEATAAVPSLWRKWAPLPFALFVAGCMAATSAQDRPAQPAPMGQAAKGLIEAWPSSGRPVPYLTMEQMPDGRALVPPPPKAGSAAMARDLEAAQRAIALRGGARWKLATSDADLFDPAATATFACAAGRQIDAESTPATFRLLTRTGVSFANSTASAKNQYMRPRPFMENGQPSCTPDAESHLRHNGSYPSGHSAIGYGWSLVLAELIPDRTTALIARGRAFGDSRRICNVHWLSDIEEGRVTATSVFVRLQASPAFQSDLEAVRQELASSPAVAPKRDCAAEATALAEE